MFTVSLAKLNIGIDNKYGYIENMCKDYITKADPDFIVSASPDDVEMEVTSSDTDRGYAESLAIYRKIALRLLPYNGFLMHGVVADIKGAGVAFLAPSGTGKSTHAELWHRFLGDDFVYVNGDKPLVRIINNKVYAYGTPWAGKENLHSNMETQIKKVCFIRQAKKNNCVRLKKSEVLEPLMKQVYLPNSTDGFLSFLNLLSIFIGNIDFYRIDCDISEDAAKIAYGVIFDDKC